MTGYLVRFKYNEKPRLMDTIRVNIHAFIDAGVVYSKPKGPLLLHPYERQFNKWKFASEREFTELQVYD